MLPSQNYHRLLENLENIKASYGVSYPISVVVVTKYAELSEIRELLANAKIEHVGENRVHEAEEKFVALQGDNTFSSVVKHMLGPVQSNKINKICKIFDFVQSIDDIKKAEKIYSINRKISMLVEVKTSYEGTKHGVLPEMLEEFFSKLIERRITVSGLMTIAPNTNVIRRISKSFETLRNLKETLERTFNVYLKYLSMGMSNDYEIAIKEGSNMIRVGSIIFKK